jgi:hypothetical protein
MKLVNLIFVGLVMAAVTVTAYGQGMFPQPDPVGEFTLGSDGTIYIITHVAPTSTASASTEITAYDGTTGKTKPGQWPLTIPIGLSQPVPAPDGRLFFVVEGHPAYSTKSTTVAAENAQVIIVTPAGTFSSSSPMQLRGETAFGPVFFGTSASYTYYFTVTNFSTGSSGKPVITAVLDAYSDADALVFSIPLN